MHPPIKRKPAAKPATSKKRKSPERELQYACMDYLKLQYGRRLFYFHTPNGGRRHKEEGAVFKKLGVMAGIPDLLFLTPVKTLFERFGGVAIELKAKGRKANTSPKQDDVISRLRALGYFVAVVETLPEFISIIDRLYGNYKISAKK